VSLGSRLRELRQDAERSRAGALLGRIAGRLGEASATDFAAAMTYYGFLALFPALIVLVALLGLIGSYPETYNSIMETLREAAPGSAVESIDGALNDALRSRGTAGGLLGVGLVLALYSATSGTGAALRGIRAIERADQKVPFVRGILTRLGLTLAVMLTLLVAFTAVLVAGPLFSDIGEAAGVGDAVKSAVSLARWPIGVASLITGATLLYRAAAIPRETRLGELLPGALAASGLWIVASIGFNAYVSNFSSYDATYGSLGAVIVLLIWLWVGNLALLAGAALNAELREERR
jgi:membrane protein